MIYPTNFEAKIGFDKIRVLLKAQCLSPLGKGLADELTFSSDPRQVNRWMEEIR